jgi:hypothetical protein
MHWVAPSEKEAFIETLEKRWWDIKKQNPQLAGVLPKTHNLFTSTLLKELLRKVSEIPASLDYDATGQPTFAFAA